MTQTAANIDELDRHGHLYGEELRENIIQHYVQKFHDHWGQAPSSLMETRSWVAGTAGATTRQEKVEVLDRICKT